MVADATLKQMRREERAHDYQDTHNERFLQYTRGKLRRYHSFQALFFMVRESFQTQDCVDSSKPAST